MLTVIAISDGHAHFHEPIQIYIKRMEKYIHFQFLRPQQGVDSSTIIRKESLLLKENLLRKKVFTIYLDIAGLEVSTEVFADKVQSWQSQYGDIRLVVGGAFGVDMNLVGSCFDFCWSLGKLTLPHSLALLIVLEQLYRIHQIQKGSKYHHG